MLLWFAEWLAGDELCDRCRIYVVPDEDRPEEYIPGPGEYEVTWRRYVSTHLLF